jgi:hypothetical protein
MNWDILLPGIASVLGVLTGLDVRDLGAPPGFTDPVRQAKLEYRVIACSGIGQDEYRYAYDAGADTMRLTLSGVRKFTVAVRCEGYDQGSARGAQWYLERIYTRLNLPNVNDYFDSLNVAWIDAGPYVDLPTEKDNRLFSVGSKDFVFTTSVNESADGLGDPLLPVASPVPYIQSVQFVSQYLYAADGSTHVAPQIDLTVLS